MMPGWLQMLSAINPLTYQVDALRSFMVTDAVSYFGLFVDFAVGIVTFAILVILPPEPILRFCISPSSLKGSHHLV